MSNQSVEEQIEILRRIAERGIRTERSRNEAQGIYGHALLDSWQHLLDEIARLKKMIGEQS